jgi:hypothetical protein
MSVLVPDLKVFEAIFRKVNSFRFTKVCDINYCYTLSSVLGTEDKVKDFVKNLLELNELSFIKRYREEGEPDLGDFLKFDYSVNSIETLQLLKYLNCINYNIEIETIKHGYAGGEDNKIREDLMDSYELLQKAIQDLSGTVIAELTHYRDLNYSEVA